MRIIYVSCNNNGSKWAEVYTNQLLNGLKNTFYEISTICPDHYSSVEKFNQDLINVVKTKNFQLCIFASNEEVVFLDTLNLIKGDLKTVLLCFDNAQNPFEFKNIVNHVDLVWVFDRYNFEYFRKLNANYFYLTWGANSNYYRALPGSEKLISRVMFAGNVYGSRVKMINDLLRNDIPVDLYLTSDRITVNLNNSNLFSKLLIILKRVNNASYYFNLVKSNHGRKILLANFLSLFQNGLDIENPNLRLFERVDYNRLTYLFQSYKLVLNSSYLNNTGYLKNPIEIINLRVFEIPALGGLELTQQSTLASNYFEDGVDIVFYNKTNIKSKISYYLFSASDYSIRKMQSAAHQKVKNNHSWHSRMDTIISLLQLIKN